MFLCNFKKWQIDLLTVYRSLSDSHEIYKFYQINYEAQLELIMLELMWIRALNFPNARLEIFKIVTRSKSTVTNSIISNHHARHT